MSRPRRSIGSQRNPASEQAILAAAEEILAQKGHAGFTIEAVARRARAGKPTIYRWWPSRTHLLLAVYRRQKDQVRYTDTGTLEGDLAAFLEDLLAFWRDSPAGNVFRSIIAEAQSDETAAQAFIAYQAERRESNATWLARHLPKADAHLVSELTVAYAIHRLVGGRLDVGKNEIATVARFLAARARPSRR